MIARFYFSGKDFEGTEYIFRDDSTAYLFDYATDILEGEEYLHIAPEAHSYPTNASSDLRESLHKDTHPLKRDSFIAAAGFFGIDDENPRSVLFIDQYGSYAFVYDYARYEIVLLIYEPFIVRGPNDQDIDSEDVLPLIEGSPRKAMAKAGAPFPKKSASAPKQFISDYNYGSRYLRKNEAIYVNDKINRGLFEEIGKELPMSFTISGTKETFQRDFYTPLAGIYIKGAERFREVLFADRREKGKVIALDIEKKAAMDRRSDGVHIAGAGLSYTFEELLTASGYKPISLTPSKPNTQSSKPAGYEMPAQPERKEHPFRDEVDGLRRYDFGEQARGRGDKIIYNSYSYRDRFLDLSEKIKGKSLTLGKSATLIPDNEETRNLARLATSSFDIGDYYFLCAVFGFDREARTAVITRRDCQGEIMVVNPENGKVYAFSTIGCVFHQDGVRMDYEGLLYKCGFQPSLSPRGKEEPKVEETASLKGAPKEKAPIEKEPIIEGKSHANPPSIDVEALKGDEPEAVSDTLAIGTSETSKREETTPHSDDSDELEEPNEESVIEDEADTPVIIPERRVWARGSFVRHVNSFLKRHRTIVPRLDLIIQNLLTRSDETLAQFLSTKRIQPMSVKGVGVYKIRLSQSGELKGSRLFFAYGDECPFIEEASRGDIVLLDFSEPSEHDEQTEIAEDLKKDLINPDDDFSELTFKLNSLPLCPSISVHPILTASQKASFHGKSLPLVLTGSAGTGKTLISIEAYREERRNKSESKVLYVTYFAPLAEKVSRLIEELDGKEADAISFEELLSISGQQISAGRDDFHSYIDSCSRNRNTKNLLSKISKNTAEAESIAYTFFRGIITGSALLMNAREAYPSLSLKRFLDLTKDEEGYDRETRSAIWEIGQGYLKKLKEEDRLTDNFASLKRLRSDIRGEYDAIIVDEAQDLTELCLLSIATFLKPGSRSFYLFGDDNQAINPTLFRLGDASKCLYRVFPGIEISAVSLKEAYRSSEFLVSFINKWNGYKKVAIGAYGSENDAPERGALREAMGSEPRLLLGKNVAEETYRNKDLFSGDTFFIFPSFSALESFKKSHKNVPHEFLHSIEEAKGLEWDNVVLVDFLTYRKEAYEGMLSGSGVGKHSTIHRMLFNRFYVALTRAKDRILIIETDPGEEIMEKILKDIPQAKTANEAADYLADALPKEEWLRLALDALHSHQPKMARGYLRRIDESEWSDAERLLSEDIALYQGKDEFEKCPRKKAAPYIKMLIRRKDLPYLRSFYAKRKEDDALRLLNGLRNDAIPIAESLKSLSALSKRKDRPDEEMSLWERWYLTIVQRRIEKLINEHRLIKRKEK